jgi:hypothetical protein
VPRPLRVLLVTKGHPFAREQFFAVFDADTGIEWTHVEQPAAQALFDPERAAAFDVFVMYDMPGIRFTRGEPPVEFADPPAAYAEGFRALLAAGKAMVFLHHAIAGWPSWEEYAEIVGGRFHYQPGTLRGVAYPDSGYRFDVTHRVEVLDPDHPICAGVGDGFELTDELYLFPVLDDVVPLMRSTYDFAAGNFASADLAIRGRRNENQGWSHPQGSNLVAWVKNAANSPVAYVQFGDGPATYADANYRRVVANAIRWTSSAEAHHWARARHEQRS